MTDPTYTYIKGKGWVPTFGDFKQAVIGKYLVTATKRTPVDGENFFTQSSYAGRDPAELILEALQQPYWIDIFNRPEKEDVHRRMPIWGPDRYGLTSCVTITYERLDYGR